MMRTSPWVITVPVISTAHMPATDSIAKLDSPFMIWPDGGMVWISDAMDDMDEPWLREIAGMVECPDQWVRLDADGPVIDGLTTYEW